MHDTPEPVDGVRLDRILPGVEQPARYTGGEWNSVRKDWSRTPIRVALAYPDMYEVGMSNLGLAILYELLNDLPDVLAERVYAPWTDMEQALRAAGLPLYSLESRRPLAAFDWIGFSLAYELNYTNVLNMLDLAGIPVRAARARRALPAGDRRRQHDLQRRAHGRLLRPVRHRRGRGGHAGADRPVPADAG